MNELKTFTEQLQPRDSILIADQILYGVRLESVPDGSSIELPQVGDTLSRELLVVRPWSLDTLKTHKKEHTRDIQAGIVITTFDEGEYLLPAIPAVVHRPDGTTDTLTFAGEDILVCTMPVDTATFQIHDIKPQMKYPVTFGEILPWAGGALFLGALIAGIVYLVRRKKRRIEEELRHDPPHIVALRKLDAYRGDKYWAPARQKAFYSGVTDALREYMSARYGIGAMEMTTAEIFTALKNSDIPSDMRDDLKTLFERSDFVKFAKYIAADEENAAVLPLSVRFVTSTYQQDIKEENTNDVL